MKKEIVNSIFLRKPLAAKKKLIDDLCSWKVLAASFAEK